VTSELYTLLRALPRSEAEATSVAFLERAVGRNERAIRDDIKVLREVYGYGVVCLPTRRGVWLSDDPADLDKEIACQQSRLDSLSRSIARLKHVRARLAAARETQQLALEV
jgi:hypothetical protein